MKKIKLPCGKETIVDDDVYGSIGELAWHALPTDYVTVTMGSKKNKMRLYLHRYIVRPRPGFEVDHLNKNRLDNRRENLKECTRGQNQHGTSRSGKKYSPYKGVTKNPAATFRPWTVNMGKDGKVWKLGCYSTEMEAALAHDIAAIQAYGIHAKTNFLPPGNWTNIISDINVKIPKELERARNV